MLIVQLTGGLGNQMFQYSFAKALQAKGYEVKLDISTFETYTLHGGFGLEHYTITLPIASKEELTPYKTNFLTRIGKKFNLPNKKLRGEKTLLFQQELLSPPDNTSLYGYFQSEKYFNPLRHTILEEFTLKAPLSPYSAFIEKTIHSLSNTASIHIRRGDYITDSKANKFHGICGLDYYEEAIALLDSKFEAMHYFIFSDDIEWVKNNLSPKNCTYIDNPSPHIPHEDIYLMSLCHHNIIANSSFSWWGAWLNHNSTKVVIAPKKWFADDKMVQQSRDIVPESWSRV
ncbi:MAG: alpha-1,2-fucosyltransferase [Sulfuricurvum sp.]|nr:alpha-1,2-fucosyltransferase [Sulfuricurvum sp.]